MTDPLPEFVFDFVGLATEACAYCGPLCYRGATHNARVEAGAFYVVPEREIFYFPTLHSPARRMRHAEAAARHAAEDVFAFGGS